MGSQGGNGSFGGGSQPGGGLFERFANIRAGHQGNGGGEIASAPHLGRRPISPGAAEGPAVGTQSPIGGGGGRPIDVPKFGVPDLGAGGGLGTPDLSSFQASRQQGLQDALTQLLAQQKNGGFGGGGAK